MMFAVIQLRTWLSSVASDNDDRGASLIEYALLLALIAVVCVVGVTVLGNNTSEGLSKTADGFP